MIAASVVVLAVVKPVDLFYVYFAQCDTLADGGVSIFWYDRRVAIATEGIFWIVHYGAIVIRKIQRVCFSVAVCLKIVVLV